MARSSKTRASSKRKHIALQIVFPQLSLVPDSDIPFPAVVGIFGEDGPKFQNTTTLINDSCDPGEVTLGELAAFINAALINPKSAFLVEVAAAHLVAANALRDLYFRRDRYKTRVDEAVSGIWEMAQEIYEVNHALAVPYEGARSASRRCVGLEPHGRKWASADKDGQSK